MLQICCITSFPTLTVHTFQTLVVPLLGLPGTLAPRLALLVLSHRAIGADELAKTDTAITGIQFPQEPVATHALALIVGEFVHIGFGVGVGQRRAVVAAGHDICMPGVGVLADTAAVCPILRPSDGLLDLPAIPHAMPIVGAKRQGLVCASAQGTVPAAHRYGIPIQIRITRLALTSTAGDGLSLHAVAWVGSAMDEQAPTLHPQTVDQTQLSCLLVVQNILGHIYGPCLIICALRPLLLAHNHLIVFISNKPQGKCFPILLHQFC